MATATDASLKGLKVHLQPIVYATNMDRSLAWYREVLDIEPTMTSEHWSTFEAGDATLALHHSDQARGAGDVGLSLVVDDLDRHAQRLGIDEITEQPFGRSFVIVDPDGTSIQVNEHS